MAENTRTLEPGTLVDGRYEIVGRIGRGGFATVYRSKHLQLDRPAALKILDPITSGTSENFIQRFLSEARIVANLRHPNVVMIYDFGVVREEQPYIAMDLLEGHDLETELTNHGPMQPDRAKRLFMGVLDALNAGHEKQIVHKDLKPSNLFLVHPRSDKEKLVILDYGIARVADSDSPRLTQTGGYTGTPAYMPPEYIRESIVSPTNDVYQIGLILIEVMTGEPVINEKTSVACMVAHLGGMRNIPDWVSSSQWGPIIEKALEIEHQDRFQNAGEFMEALVSGQIPSTPRERTLNEMNKGLAESSSEMLGQVSNYTPYPAIVAPPNTVSAPPAPNFVQEPGAGIPPISQAEQIVSQPVQNPSSARTTQPPRQQAAPESFARIAPKPKKKSKLLWFLLFFFVGIPLIAIAIFLSVIYGYYGGFTEYGEAITHSLQNVEPPKVRTTPTQAEPNDVNRFLAKQDNESPKSDSIKIQNYVAALNLVYNHLYQFEMFEVTVKNHGHANAEDLAIPTGGNDLIEMAVSQVQRASAIKGGPKGIEGAASAFTETARTYRRILEELTDHYKVDQGHLKDKGAQAKLLHNSLSRADRDLKKESKKFRKAIAVYYKANYGRCAEEAKKNSFSQNACLVLLRAWEFQDAVQDGRGEKTALKRYQRALSKLKASERKSRSLLESKNTYRQHTNFVGEATGLLSEGRAWIERDPPTKWPNRIPLPDSPWEIDMAMRDLLQTYVNVVE